MKKKTNLEKVTEALAADARAYAAKYGCSLIQARGVLEAKPTEYISPDFRRIPKIVYAKIAWSLAARMSGADPINDGASVYDLLLEEWDALYDNGIVKQKPIRIRERGSGA